MAHLAVFSGSDTVEGIRYANHYYSAKMAAFSIPAMEHSTVTSWGRDGEVDAYRNMLRQFKSSKYPAIAVVSDSYDLWNAIENLWTGELLEDVKARGGVVVIRPDSGVPEEVVLKVLQLLTSNVGYSVNAKGYKVLPSYFRVIQGDGVNEESIARILQVITDAGFSAENVSFGMGGALLQKLDRDTQRFAYKLSEVTVNGTARPCCKSPVTDMGKASKAGRLALVRVGGALRTVAGPSDGDVLRTVYQDGEMFADCTLDGVRARVASDC